MCLWSGQKENHFSSTLLKKATKDSDAITSIGVMFLTKQILYSSLAGPKTHSRLIINQVVKEDSGNYTCSAPKTRPSSIDVFVSPGEL